MKFDIVFQLHVHDVFQQFQRNVFSTGLHFCFWKLPNVFANVFDVFGIWWEDANGWECFWNNIVTSNKLNSPRLWTRRSLWRTFIFVHVAAAFYNRANQLEQEKFKHACCMFAWTNCTDSLLSLFSCVEKGIEFCSDSRRVLGNLLCLSDARRGVKQLNFDPIRSKRTWLVVVIRFLWIFARSVRCSASAVTAIGLHASFLIHMLSSADPRPGDSWRYGLQRPGWPWWSGFLQWWLISVVSVPNSIGWGPSPLAMVWRRHAKTHCCLGIACAVCVVLFHWCLTAQNPRTNHVPSGHGHSAADAASAKGLTMTRHLLRCLHPISPLWGDLGCFHILLASLGAHSETYCALQASKWPKSVESGRPTLTFDYEKKGCCSALTGCLHRLVFGEFFLRLVDCR